MRCLFPVALAVVISCGDNLVPTIELSDVDAERQRAECSRLVRCGLFADQLTCEGFFRPPLRTSLHAAIDAGIVHYDGASAKRCFDALATATCDATAREVRVVPGTCDEIFRGTLEVGAQCAFDDECASGACDAPACLPTTCCPGTCGARVTGVEIGDACDTTRVCVDDAYCGKDGLCHSLEAIRQPCADDSNCEYGLACIGATHLQDGTCRELSGLDGPCPFRRCADIGAVCDDAFVCVAAGLAGSPCTTDAECSRFAFCDQQLGACTPMPQLGASCVASSSRCTGETWCDGETCVVTLDNGLPCDANNECTSTYCAEGPVFDYCVDRAICF